MLIVDIFPIILFNRNIYINKYSDTVFITLFIVQTSFLKETIFFGNTLYLRFFLTS